MPLDERKGLNPDLPILGPIDASTPPPELAGLSDRDVSILARQHPAGIRVWTTGSYDDELAAALRHVGRLEAQRRGLVLLDYDKIGQGSHPRGGNDSPARMSPHPDSPAGDVRIMPVGALAAANVVIHEVRNKVPYQILCLQKGVTPGKDQSLAALNRVCEAVEDLARILDGSGG